jgi:ParB family chromosome partitioning protein
MKINQAKTRNVTDNLMPVSSFSRRPSAFNESSKDEIVYLHESQLVPYKKQSRTYFSDDEIRNLADTIQSVGIRQPLTVLRIPNDPPAFEVISGERRLRAARLLGIETLPCIILDNEKKAEEIAIIENIQREDLHPIELARGLKMLMSDYGWGGQSELEKKIGISQERISKYIKMLELSESIQSLAIEKRFSSRDGLLGLLKLNNDGERKKVIEEIDADKKIRAIPKSFSVLRVSLLDNSFKIQNGAFKRLNSDQRKSLKEELLNLVNLLD